MFGSNAFGSTPSSGFGTGGSFGQPQQQQQQNNNPFGASSAFGAKPAGSAFGATTTTFGQPQQQQQPQAGGLFGAQNTASSGGLFGATNTATPAFGGFGGSTAFKPSFGATATTTAAPGGLFGAQQQTTTSTGLFGQPSTSAFGQAQPTNTGFGGTTGFGGGFTNPSAQQSGTTIKFAAPSGSDTMMKSGVQTQISTRHQCITCMKEYENKSIEELRCEDYLAGRKGGGTGATQPQAGGLFGSSTPAAQPTGGLFGASATSTAAGGMFGQQQNKPLFGTSGFGGTATSAAPAFGGFGAQQPVATNTGGLFGAAKPAFGATATTATGGFGGFGTNTSTSTSLFGAQNKPFGAAAPQPATSGGLFGSTTNTGFGAANTGFGAANTGFGQPQQQQQSIGLFGAQQQKPAGFGGFGAASTAAAPAFGGFGAATTAQSGGLFGQNQKPAFTGFAPTSAAPTVGFGQTNTGFGATSGGLFGATQNKPAFSLGGTSTAPATGFGGGFGTTNTGTGLFGNTQAKPGGLFGTTTTGFGAATTGIGTGTGFGAANTGFGGGGLNFGAAPQQQQQQAAPQAPPNNIQQQLLSLAASPFGDNPLFKPLLADTGKRQEVLKPTNPAAQKALAASQYKVSPHRNIKVRAKPLDGSGSKSAMFDGLDDDYISTTGDLFVPRSSCKKLVLRSKPADSSTSILSTTASTTAPPDINDQSLTVPLDESRLNVKKPDLPRLDPDNNLSEVDESFAALNPRKAMPAPAQIEEEAADQHDGEHDDKDNSGPSCDSTIGTIPEEAHPAGIVLKRAGYYTMPPLADLKPDPDGACNVEGFTIGREGYGNIYFPGTIDIAGMNFDENVFFRHKEVIVYPDDGCKPPQGEGLNRKAQITLDKVWPVDKSNKSAIKSPERLHKMDYAEKLERASLRLGARFMEYRPETGSWVFKVDHFSKYGLDDSDEEEVVDNNKKLKTLQLEKRSNSGMMLDNNAKNIVLNNSNKDIPLGVTKPVGDSMSQMIQAERQETVESDGIDSAASDEDMADVSRHKWAGLRSALFAEAEDDVDMGSSLARPVILQQRSALAPTRRNVIEDIANSVLGPPSKGLGGISMMEHTGVSSSLLRSQFASHSGDMTSSFTGTGGTMSQSSWTKPRQSKLPTYNLQAGYDRFLQLQSSGPSDKPQIFVPQHFHDTGPLSSSHLAGRQSQLADTGLYINASFRVGFGNNWVIASSGGSLDPMNLEKKLSCDVSIEQLSITSCGAVDKDQVASIEDWLEVSLENSRCEMEGLNGPCYSPETHPDTLQKHGQEATRQIQQLDSATQEFHTWVSETKNTWDLMLALWGSLDDGEDMEEVGETHGVTMARREAVSAWLEDVVGPAAREDLERAVSKGDQPAKVSALLNGGSVEDSCKAAQGAGDHRTALLLAQVGGGTNASKLAMQQLDSWTQVKTNQHITEKRRALYSLAAGSPVWVSTNGPVNTCQSLYWKRAFAAHLWYLTHPFASVSDALYDFEAAFLGSSSHGLAGLSYIYKPHSRSCDWLQRPSDKPTTSQLLQQLANDPKFCISCS